MDLKSLKNLILIMILREKKTSKLKQVLITTVKNMKLKTLYKNL